MTKEDKKLLLIDLCARLLSGVRLSINEQMATLYGIDEGTIIAVIDGKNYKEEFILSNGRNKCDIVKPYLRPMSSMTEDESSFVYNGHIQFWVRGDYCNKYHLDFRNLIKEQLALEAPEGMYKID